MSAQSSHHSVSVVIPAYNAERLIAEAIESALAQTYDITEIVVIDDGSSDNTSDVAAKFQKTKVLKQRNGGPGSARNTGINAAKGDWIALLDSDDLWLPHKTETQVGFITPDAGVIHANEFNPINFGNLWHRQTHVTPSGALVRKQTLLDAGGFEESRTIIGVEDLNIWLKIALTNWQFVRSEPDLFGYRPSAQSLSGNDMKMARSELANIDIIGKLVKCQSQEVERVKQASKIEYAKNLIAGQRWDDAAQLLSECAPGFASRWLSLARTLKTSRMARTNLVRWLHVIDARYESHDCSGECILPEPHRQICMESCHVPYYRLSPHT